MGNSGNSYKNELVTVLLFIRGACVQQWHHGNRLFIFGRSFERITDYLSLGTKANRARVAELAQLGEAAVWGELSASE